MLWCLFGMLGCLRVCYCLSVLCRCLQVLPLPLKECGHYPNSRCWDGTHLTSPPHPPPKKPRHGFETDDAERLPRQAQDHSRETKRERKTNAMPLCPVGVLTGSHRRPRSVFYYGEAEGPNKTRVNNQFSMRKGGHICQDRLILKDSHRNKQRYVATVATAVFV
jgi:hypothetical protein